MLGLKVLGERNAFILHCYSDDLSMGVTGGYVIN